MCDYSRYLAGNRFVCVVTDEGDHYHYMRKDMNTPPLDRLRMLALLTMLLGATIMGIILALWELGVIK